jgi:hypothetical protein
VSDKKALIITDGIESIQLIAGSIKDALTGFDYTDVKVCSAAEFDGTDLLPAELFFLGCEKPQPESFEYLEKMLAHINLASRKCGVFSTCESALIYLGDIVKDCEVSLGKPLLVSGDKANSPSVEIWLEKLLNPPANK